MTAVPVAERCSMCKEPDGIRAEYRCLECGALVCGEHADEHQMAAHATPEEQAYNERFEAFQALPFWRQAWIYLTGRQDEWFGIKREETTQ